MIAVSDISGNHTRTAPGLFLLRRHFQSSPRVLRSFGFGYRRTIMYPTSGISTTRRCRCPAITLPTPLRGGILDALPAATRLWVRRVECPVKRTLRLVTVGILGFLCPTRLPSLLRQHLLPVAARPLGPSRQRRRLRNRLTAIRRQGTNITSVIAPKLLSRQSTLHCISR